MLDQQTKDQLDRIERMLQRLLGDQPAIDGLSVLQEASMNDLARDFGKRGVAALAEHNERRKKSCGGIRAGRRWSPPSAASDR